MEMWCMVDGYENYEISSTGRLRKRIFNPLQMDSFFYHRGCQRSGGYIWFALFQDGKVKQRPAHRMVLEAFVGYCPNGMESRHLNGARNDNRLENLAWGTKVENAKDRAIHGTQCRGETHGRAKVTEAQVRQIREEYQRLRTRQVDLAERYGIAQTKISAIIRRELWRHVA